MKDVEEALRNINFSKLSKIRKKLLLKILDDKEELSLEELDQVVAARDEEWWSKINKSTE